MRGVAPVPSMPCVDDDCQLTRKRREEKWQPNSAVVKPGGSLVCLLVSVTDSKQPTAVHHRQHHPIQGGRGREGVAYLLASVST